MNKFITKIFKSAGVNAKVSRDTESPRFRVVDNALTLEGLVTSDRYTMTIKDKVVPNLVGVDIGCGMLVAKIKAKFIEFGKLDKVFVLKE